MHLLLINVNVQFVHFLVHRKNPMILLRGNRAFHMLWVRHEPTNSLVCVYQKIIIKKQQKNAFRSCQKGVNEFLFFFDLLCNRERDNQIELKLTNPGRSSIFNSSILFKLGCERRLYENSRGIHKFLVFFSAEKVSR